MAKRYEATEAFFDRAFSAYQGPFKNGTATPTQIEEIADWLLMTYEIQQRKAAERVFSAVITNNPNMR